MSAASQGVGPEGKPRTAIVHYTAPPVVGGVEAVIQAQASVFLEAGHPVAVVSGRGDSHALPSGAEFLPILEMDSQHPLISRLNSELEAGDVPAEFDGLVRRMAESLGPILDDFDSVIVHNIFTKHFNLPLTAALIRLLDGGRLRGCIAWCHDFSWTSPNSRRRVHPGYPWDLLRTYHPAVTYVTISEERREELAGMLGCSTQDIQLIYNGVDPRVQLGLSNEGWDLIQRLDLLNSDLILLMPVRVTQAKNIETALKVTAELKGKGLRVRTILTGPPDPHDPNNLAYFHQLKSLRARLGVEGEFCFVYENGPEVDTPYTIDPVVVGDLFRVADIMFMPSLREGFGMPVLEAGLAGLQVVCSEIPAAREIAASDVIFIDPKDEPRAIAEMILHLGEASPAYRMRRRVRQEYTWQAIFKRQIEPLLGEGGRK